jgi:hypothetical protein
VIRAILSRASTPLQSLTDTPGNPSCLGSPLGYSAIAPSEVLSPTTFCQSTGAPISQVTSHVHLLRLRPQGFSPSRRLALPKTCQAYFILVPSLGFTLQGFGPPADAVCPLEHRLPLEVASGSRLVALLQGLIHLPKSRWWSLGFSQVSPPDTSLGLVPFEVCVTEGAQTRRSVLLPSPLALLRLYQRVMSRRRLRVYGPPDTLPFSREIGQPPWDFPPRRHLACSGWPSCWVTP